MKILLLFIISLFFLQGCSSAQPKNQWQYQAASSLKAYTKHYLEGNELRAKADLTHAREEASRSARLYTLIDIELTVCAIHIGVLSPKPCQKASKLLTLESDPSQKAYLDLLNKQLSSTQIKDLPGQYREFATSLLANDINASNDDIRDIEPLTSRLVASALIKERLSAENIQSLINELSYHGYKRALLAWLKLQIEKEKDPQTKAKLIAKLKVLISY